MKKVDYNLVKEFIRKDNEIINKFNSDFYKDFYDYLSEKYHLNEDEISEFWDILYNMLNAIKFKDMAYSLADVREAFKKQAPRILEHTIKIILYDNETNDKNGWLITLSNIFSYLSYQKISGNNKKLEQDEMIKYLLNDLIESLSEAEEQIENEYRSCLRKNFLKIPDFKDKINKFAEKLYKVYWSDYQEKIIPMLNEKDNYKLNDFYPILTNAFN